MSSLPSKEIDRLSSLFQLGITVMGTLGACAGVFFVMGYMIVLSFLTSQGLYGLVEFPGFFYKEALMTFVKDGVVFVVDLIGFFFDHLVGFIIVGAAVWLVKWLVGFFLWRHGVPQIVKQWTFWVVVLATVLLFAHPRLIARSDAGLSVFVQKLILYLGFIPAYIALCVYLVSQHQRSVQWKILFTTFLVLTLAIPSMYGAQVYDINCYQVGRVYPANEADGALPLFSDIGDNTYYVMGHTASRDIFFRSVEGRLEAKAIDKTMIRAVSINDVLAERKLRDLRRAPLLVPGAAVQAPAAPLPRGDTLSPEQTQKLFE